VKIFISEKLGKINFMDENNVLLGFDIEQNCCENFGFFISNRICVDPIVDTPDGGHEGRCDPIQPEEDKYKDFVFDTEFFQEITSPVDTELTMAVFRIVHKDDDWDYRYIHLYNIHNGYYVHNFTFGSGNKVIREQSL